MRPVSYTDTKYGGLIKCDVTGPNVFEEKMTHK
jgi:hypothetical protein